jgi:hypothetical protein
MVDLKYLYRGLCGMSRAHRANAMTGHLGAAVVTGYFVGEELPDLDGRVYPAIEQNLDRIIRGDESVWYDAGATGIRIPDLFEAYPGKSPSDPPAPELAITTISSALAKNIDQLRETGHNVIFTSIAIRALHEYSRYATDAIVSGIEKLIALFNEAGTGRGYYGKERGWVAGNDIPADESNDFPAYRDQQEMVEVVIDELIATAQIRRRGFGGLFHVINHAAALTELSRLGLSELAQRGLPAHHEHVRLWRSLPDVEPEFGPLVAAHHDPQTPEYWEDPDSRQWSAHLTHRVKTLYGLSVLFRFIESDTRKKHAREKFLYLMG